MNDRVKEQKNLKIFNNNNNKKKKLALKLIKQKNKKTYFYETLKGQKFLEIVS